MAHLDALLAVGGELRPVLGDRRCEVEFATVGEQERAQGGHRLRAGVDVDDGVGKPGFRPRRVAMSGPQVDHELAFERHRERRTHIAEFGEVALERLAHRLKTRVATAVQINHGPSIRQGETSP